MESKTEAKIIRLTDYEKATAHTWQVTKIPDSYPASSKGYKAGSTFYTLMEPGFGTASHDLHELRSDPNVGMTEREFSFLNESGFSGLEDGKNYEL